MLEALSSDNWFIADRAHLRESFQGKLPLLAFTIKDLEDMKDLLHALRLDDHRLSARVETQCHPLGRISMHLAYTETLRARAIFIKE